MSAPLFPNLLKRITVSKNWGRLAVGLVVFSSNAQSFYLGQRRQDLTMLLFFHQDKGKEPKEESSFDYLGGRGDERGGGKAFNFLQLSL